MFSASSASHQLVPIGPTTKFILSTSGRPASARRYKVLLTDLLQLDVVYMPISSDSVGPGGSGGETEGKIDPQPTAS